MPNTPGAKKRLRQDMVRRDRNRADKTRMRGLMRSFREAVEANDLEKAETLSRSLTKVLDQFSAKGILHANKAARLKSRFSKLLLTKKSA